MSKRILQTNGERKKTTNSATLSLSNTGKNVIVDMKSDDSEEEINIRKGVFTAKRTSTRLSQSREDAESPSLSSSRKRKSWIWSHFDEIGNTRTGKCKYCPAKFVISGTGTMSKHIHSKHSTILAHSNHSTSNLNGKSGKLETKCGMSKGILGSNSVAQKTSNSPLSNLLSTSGIVTSELNESDEDGEQISSKQEVKAPKRKATSLGQLREEIESPSFSHSKKRKSWIWMHFDEIGNTRTCKCKYCPSSFVISGTGTMSKHMRSKHPALLSQSNQSPAVSTGEVMQPFKYDVNAAHKAYGEFVVSGGHALTLGEQLEFRNFISKLRPLYKPLSGAVVKDRLMETYERLRLQVIEKLSKSKVALTTDLWTSPNNLSFMGITAVIWNERSTPVEIIIGCKQIVGDQSGVNLAEKFCEIVSLYQLNENILAITTDNATSNQTFMDHIIQWTKDNSHPFNKDSWIRCFAHIINLCVKCALEDMFVLLQKLRDLIVAIRASLERVQQFKEILKECEFELSELDYEEDELFSFDGAVITDDLLPFLDCREQWSSTYFFLKRGLKLRRAIDEIAKDQELCQNELKEEDWLILEQVFSFLEKFALVTTYVETSHFPTLSLVIPMYNRLLNLLEETSRDESKHTLIVKGASAGLQILSAYYEEASPLLMAATFMDPRCKMQYFVESGCNFGGETGDGCTVIEDRMAARVKPVIEKLWREYNIRTNPCDPSSNSNLENVPKNESSAILQKGLTITKTQINTYIANVIFGRNRTPSIKPEKDEMKEYEEEETEPADCNQTAVFDYWSSRSTRWPRLSVMAKDLLCIPATSAASKRAFSTGRDLFGIAKMTLTLETVEALVCLRSWYKAGLVEEMDVQEFIEKDVGSHND
ncbi:uncharacterized protein LOC130694417 [Daphnia carinata]|uniref:uncharacterized protein LOC130694417 n=1 Tax=Daphnia carinata TaxID=120202 RepID=UPI0025800450|nr:uncharacterized protein LOC130694417 [Daphnia carinata]